MPAKIFPARRKNPPPPVAMAEIQPQVDILRDGIVLRFNEEINFLLMSARGARILAASLINHADVLDNISDSADPGEGTGEKN